MIKIIVAHDESNVIGFNNTIPWKNPEDMKLFKEATLNNTVIMGRKTWDSLPIKHRPLKNRLNLVISSKERETTCGEIYFKSINEALKYPNIVGDIWIIGGAKIYEEALNLDIVEEIHASLIPGKHDGDVFFPSLDLHKRWFKYHVKCLSTIKQVIYKRNRGQLDYAPY